MANETTYAMNNDNSLIVNYHNACIYKSDIKLLESNTEWLNDACIQYQMKRLEQRRICDSGRRDLNEIRVHGMDVVVAVVHVEFVEPLIPSFFMHQLRMDDEDDCEEMVSLLRQWRLLQVFSTGDNDCVNGNSSHSKSNVECRMVLIPINDNNSADFSSFQTPGGGNHWSLLVVIQLSSSSPSLTLGVNCDHTQEHPLLFFHLDSSSGYNSSSARAVSKRIHEMYYYAADQSLGAAARGGRSKSRVSKNDVSVTVIECDVPQQRNGYDCGIYTLFNAEALGIIHSLSLEAMNIKDFNSLALEMKEKIQNCVHNHVCDNVGELAKCLRKSIAKDIRKISKSS